MDHVKGMENSGNQNSESILRSTRTARQAHHDGVANHSCGQTGQHGMMCTFRTNPMQRIFNPRQPFVK